MVSLDVAKDISILVLGIAIIYYAVQGKNIYTTNWEDKKAHVFSCDVEWEEIRDVAMVFTGDCPEHHDYTSGFLVGYLAKKIGYTIYGDEGSSVISPDQRMRFIHTVRVKPIVRM